MQINTLAKEMSEILKQAFYIENGASATGQTGAIEVAKAKPDGYTLLISSVAFGTTPIFTLQSPLQSEKRFQHCVGSSYKPSVQLFSNHSLGLNLLSNQMASSSLLINLNKLKLLSTVTSINGANSSSNKGYSLNKLSIQHDFWCCVEHAM